MIMRFASFLSLLLLISFSRAFASVTQTSPLPMVSSGGIHTKTCAQPTVSTTAYSSGQDIGGVLNFGGASRLPLTPTVLNNVTVSVSNAQTVPAFRLWLLNRYPFWSTVTDKTAVTFDASDKDAGEHFVNIPATSLQSLGAYTLWEVDGINQVYVPTEDTSMYGILVATAAATLPSTSSLQVCLDWTQD